MHGYRKAFPVPRDICPFVLIKGVVPKLSEYFLLGADYADFTEYAYYIRVIPRNPRLIVITL